MNLKEKARIEARLIDLEPVEVSGTLLFERKHAAVALLDTSWGWVGVMWCLWVPPALTLVQP